MNHARRICRLFVAYLMILVPGGASEAASQALEVRIEGFTRAHGSVIFNVRIANRGERTVYLKAVDKEGKELAGVGIEQHREPDGWAAFTGRWIDSRPAKAIVALRPGQEVTTRVWIPDPFVEILKSPPRSLPVVGKHRATVWYYSSRKGARTSRDGHQTSSEPIEVPCQNEPVR
jgi:hypothetical protein